MTVKLEVHGDALRHFDDGGRSSAEKVFVAADERVSAALGRLHVRHAKRIVAMIGANARARVVLSSTRGGRKPRPPPPFLFYFLSLI